MALRPKKIKLAAILLLLGRNAKLKLEDPNEDEGTVYELLIFQSADLRPQMQVNDNTWTQAMNDVWDKFEELETLFDSNGDPTDELEIEKVHEDLIDLIDLL